MELLVQPRRGLSADLLSHVSVAAQSSVSFLALFTGPHGMSEDVSQYESVLLVTSGFGVAAAIPYLKKMIYGYNTCTSQVRRLHLVWQVESIDEMAAAFYLVNKLLMDDIWMKAMLVLDISEAPPPEADNNHGSRYCTSLFTSGTASERANCPSANMNESISTRESQIIEA